MTNRNEITSALGPRPLKRLTKADIEPLWSRLDVPTSRIATSLGVSRQSLSSKAKALGLPSRSGNQVPAHRSDNATFIRMWTAGVNATEMARVFGYADAASVSHRRRNLGLPARSTGTVVNAKVRNGRAETISLAEFLERGVASAMAATAAIERAAQAERNRQTSPSTDGGMNGLKAEISQRRTQIGQG
ncbi:hypothetical protein [Oceaniglobus ichthyenteri]|uniref:hypothetical protein n=1 Tax=Oceaniglobus ichthyenteri TaxID=2136177 RepID=UPI000D36B781|nr:hypothetical protein [Oceaniglobus ichthyenteri]